MKKSTYQYIEKVIRTILVFIILLNSIAPAFTVKAGAFDLNRDIDLSQSNLSPITRLQDPPPIQYDPPFEEYKPWRTDPTPDELPSKIPAGQIKKDVSFELILGSSMIENNLPFLIKARITNTSATPLKNVLFSDALEKDFNFIASPKNGLLFDEQTRTINYLIESLAIGETIEIDYFITITTTKNKDENHIWVHQAELNSTEIKLKAKLILWMGNDADEREMQVNHAIPGTEWVGLGTVLAYFNDGSVGENSLVTLNPVHYQNGPEKQFELNVWETTEINGIKSWKKNKDNKELPEQALDIISQRNKNFDAPVFLEISFDDIADLSSLTVEKTPYVATYNEKKDIWVKVPVLDINHERNTVTVQVTHFSTWGVGLGDSLPQNGANILLFDQPYTSLFTGASRYSIPIWTPPGRVEMTPGVSLSYSSATIDGVLGDVQAPWVGVGWNINGIEIIRKILTDIAGYGYENSFSLTINGTLYPLVQDENNPNRYYTDRASFMYIERHNVALANDPSPNNSTGEWWEVVTSDGTRYRLGWHEDAEQTILMYGYSCEPAATCNAPSGGYASSGYAGYGEDVVALRWRVDQITDTHKNFITYEYTEYESDPNTLVPVFEQQSYLASIKYTGHFGPTGIVDLNPGYEIRFNLASRETIGDGIPEYFEIFDNYDEYLLDSIEIYCLGCAGLSTTPVRTYDLSYIKAEEPNSHGTLVLSSLAISGGGYSENNSNIPQTEAAQISFDYANKDNRAVGGANPWTYPRLTEIHNGYGGSINYTYVHDNRGTNSWYNYRVSKVLVYDGINPSASVIQGFSYANALYIDANNLEDLIGYKNVEVKSYNSETIASENMISKTKHVFGNSGLDIGRELESIIYDPATDIEYAKTKNLYTTDNTSAPFEGWNNRYLVRSENYIYDGQELILSNAANFYRDPSYGNLLATYTFSEHELYRKTYYEYLFNPDPEIHILGVASRAVVVDVNNFIYSDSHFQYDEGLVYGDLIATQNIAGENSTVDASMSYDLYGNQIVQKIYKEYGQPGVTPSGNNYQQTTLEYDSTFFTYPIETTNPLGQTSTVSYFYSLGIPYESTNPNNWTTSSQYDGLGRVLSVSTPGLSQESVKYTYPTPVDGVVGAPYGLKMEILDTHPSTDVYRNVWGFYDGLGRIIQNQVYDADTNEYLISSTEFNKQGSVYRQSVVESQSNTAGLYLIPQWSSLDYSETIYDFMGRVTQVTAPSGIQSTNTYEGLTSSIIDANGNKKTQTIDNLGRMVLIEEYLENEVYTTTQYAYDLADRLSYVIDNFGNTTEMHYDLLGRKIAMQDPDMGIWSYQYNPMGNLLLQSDARGQILGFTYDDLNRLLTKTNKSATPEVDIASYGYGTTAGEIGFRVLMTDESGSTTWTYSNYGRIVAETKIINQESNTFTTYSDWLGRVEAIDYPDYETVVYTYDALGRPESMESDDYSSATLVDLTYNTLGQITTALLGNGAVITNHYDDLNNTYRLENRKVQVNSVDLLNFSYSYDDVGNITQIDDSVLNEILVYEYDDLYRLTSAQAVSSSTINFAQEFSYDEIGNITQTKDWDVNVNATAQVTLTPTATPAPTQSVTADPYSTATITSTPTATPTLNASPTPTATAVPNLSSDLRGYWKFDETSGSTVYNETGQMKNGSIVNAIRVDGYAGGGLEFDGDNDYVNIGSNTLSRIWSSFTMSAWIYPIAGDNQEPQYIFRLGNDYSIRENTDGYIQLYVPGVTPSTINGPKLPEDTWSHVIGIWNEDIGEFRLYVNGVLVALTSVVGETTASYDNFSISKLNDYSWTGRLDEIRIYNRAISEAEVGLLYGNVVQSTPTPTGIPTETLTPTITPTLSPTPTGIVPTATPTPNYSSPWGTGDDGDLTVAMSTTFNLNTDTSNGRTCADAKAFSVIDLSSTWAQVSETVGTCLAVNDEIMLINVQGTDNQIDNNGAHEFLRVSSINGDEITFSTPKTGWYGEGFHSDTNIGTGSDDQNTMLIRVPNYDDVTINGVLTANDWNGSLYGLILFKVSGVLSGSGTINANALGYRGGAGGSGWHYSAYNGEPIADDGHPGEGTGDNGFGGGGRGGGTWCGPSYPYTSGPGGAASYGTRGGSYPVSGTKRNGNPGLLYGGVQLSELHFGSGGGGGGVSGCTSQSNHGGEGGDGGGAIYIVADTVYFTGTITANGGIQKTPPVSGSQGGPGSGGSILVEGNTVNLSSSTLIVNGGDSTVDGGYGRMTVYYLNSYDLPSTTPPVYVNIYGAPPPPPPTPEPINLDPAPDYGDGSDGDLVVDAGETFNIHSQTQNLNRVCQDGGDAISYEVVVLSYSEATLDRNITGDCLEIGDEIMIINMKGTDAAYNNVGKYEFVKVSYVYQDIVGFATSLENYYGVGNSFDNIGDTQHVMMIRIPNYDDVTVNGTLTGSDWNGDENGLLIFRAAGTLSGTGTIDMIGAGYRGGAGANPSAGSYRGAGGESYGLLQTHGGGGGRGGVYNTVIQGIGGGGAYGTDGLKHTRDYSQDGGGGHAYGDIFLHQFFMGSGGGGNGNGGSGGNGGGSVMLITETINFTGTIDVSGVYNAGNYGAAGGVRIEGDTIILGTIDIVSGGLGGDGRFAVYYDTSFTGITQPGYLENTTTGEGIIDFVFSDSFETGDISNWFASVTDGGDLSVSVDADYWGRYGLSFVIDDTNGLSVIDDTPTNETRLRSRFYLNLDDLLFTGGDEIELYRLLDSSSTPIGWVSLRDNLGEKEIRITALLDDSTSISSNWYPLNEDWQAVNVDWRASTNSNSNGAMTLALDGVELERLGFLDNDTYAVENIMLCVEGIDTGTSGIIAVDDFEIRRLNAPALLPELIEVIPEEESDDLLFEDGFELGDFSLWTSAETDSGDLSISSTSYYGEYGISLLIDDRSEMYLTKVIPTDEKQIRIGFFLDRTNVTTSNGETIRFIELYDSTDQRIAYARITRQSGIYKISIHTIKDDGTTVSSAFYTFRTNWRSIQITWDAATEAGANDGSMTLYVDEVLKASLTTIDNDTHSIKSIDLGAKGIGNYTSGTLRMDNFEVWKTTMPLLEPIAIPEFWLTNEHSYSDLQPHAVTEVIREVSVDVFETDTYTYDANGNMVTAIETNGNAYVYSYNPENRLSVVNNVTTNEQWYFTYDGDGVRVMEDYRSVGVTEYYRYFFAGGSYEVTDDVTAADNDIIKHYYHFAGQMIASHDGTDWNFFASDHLSSASLVMDTLGVVLSENRYMPYGEVRTDTSLTAITETDFGYTGQRNYSSFGLMDYNARFYSPYQNHYTQPDTIIPGIGAMALNRYMYVKGNPIRYNDPSGHDPWDCFSNGSCAFSYLRNNYNDVSEEGYSNILSNFGKLEDFLSNEFGITFSGEWSNKNKIKAGAAILKTNKMFMKYGSNFNEAMHNEEIELRKIYQGNWLLAQIDQKGADFINFYSDDDFEFSSDLVIHELAHIFDYRRRDPVWGLIPSNSMLENINWGLVTEHNSGLNPEYTYGDHYVWGPSTILKDEIFADVFLMMVTDNNPNKDDNAYRMYNQIFNDGMPYWINGKYMPESYYPKEMDE